MLYPLIYEPPLAIFGVYCGPVREVRSITTIVLLTRLFVFDAVSPRQGFADPKSYLRPIRSDGC